MKKLILCLALATLTFGVQAGDKKDAKDAKAKDACCETKVAASKPACCAAKGAACNATPTKKALLSPKHAGQVRS